jgi:type VI secretion system secreted protein Hcp
MGGWIKISGIRGDSQNPAHLGWIEIYSVNWGSVTRNAGANREKPATSEIVVTKKVDAASAPLMRASTNGSTFDHITIDMADNAGKTQASFQFSNVIVSHVGQSSAGSDSGPVESVTFNYTDAAVTQGAASAGSAFSSATSAIAKAIGEGLAKVARSQ